MNPTTAIRISAMLGFLAVGLGAFGAHGLKPTLEAHGTVAIWEKAVFYHLIHTVMLFLLAQRSSLARGPWGCFLVGIIMFSGSLYALALTSPKWLWPITPLGGVCFLVGWAWLAYGGLRPTDKKGRQEG